MLSYITVATWLLASYVLYSIILKIVTNRHHAAEAKRLGCKPPQRWEADWFFGVMRIVEAIQHDKVMLFPDLLIARFRQAGVPTFAYKVLGIEGFLTIEPKNIQAILATQFQDFGLGPIRRGNFMPLLGNGIFTTDGAGWEHSRLLLRPQFSRTQISDLELEETHVQHMMRALPVNSSGMTELVDLQILFFRLTLDSACEFLFGQSTDSQISNLPENATSLTSDGADFATAFDRGQAYLAFRLRLLDVYWVANSREFKKMCKDCHAFIDHFVHLALNPELREKEVEKGDKYVFLEALARETRDPIELRSQLFNILLAGRDTTASLLGWVFYILARQPATFAKLRAVILADFGTFEKPKNLIFADLKSCTYLQHCLNEALRLYPVVPGNSRRALRDTTLPRGGGPDGMSKLYVKKDQQVDYSVHVMHRSKELWGPDAEEWKPERWVGRKPGWEYLPFNGGPRICLGQQLAITEASYVIVRMLQRFDGIENWETDPVVRHNMTLTSCPGNGVKVKLHAAKA